MNAMMLEIINVVVEICNEVLQVFGGTFQEIRESLLVELVPDHGKVGLDVVV